MRTTSERSRRNTDEGTRHQLITENGGTVCSADADFARFPGVQWVDPLSG
jgi:hypothetical protein